MPTPPPIDPDTLARLRAWVKHLHQAEGPSVPTDDLVRLADDVQTDAGVTIDFQASRELGQPMVVLRLAASGKPADCLNGLSRREREVVALIADGLSNKQIAARLHLALATVKDHVHRILYKTGLSNRAAIASAQRGHTAPGVNGSPMSPHHG